MSLYTYTACTLSDRGAECATHLPAARHMKWCVIVCLSMLSESMQYGVH
jgi:hypothetical protein